MGGKMLKKNADFEKVVHRKIVHHDEFCYRLKLMYFVTRCIKSQTWKFVSIVMEKYI
jgi:hypothetical protein